MLTAAVAAFITIFVAEFGDKTQLVTLTLACRYPPLQVLAGAMAALALVLGLAVGVGGLLAIYIPQQLVIIGSGIIFIIIGLFHFTRRDDRPVYYNDKRGFYYTLLMVFAAEFGDKTQLAALLLAASYGYPLAVFTGAMIAMLFNHLIAVYLGSRLLSRFHPRFIKIATALLFLLVGLVMIIGEAGIAF